MPQNLRVLIFLAFCSLGFISCEKSIDFDLDQTADKIVVEGIIETGSNPVVTISRSLNYFSAIEPDLLIGTFIRDAVVEISNGTETRILKEFADTLALDIVFYRYTIDTINEPDFFGEEGKQYSLKITTGDQVFTANTTIPVLAKTMDSIWWKQSPSNPDTNKVIVMGKFNDPPGLGNYIRYFTKTNDDDFVPGITSVFDDQIVDGKVYEIQVDRGVNRNEELDIDNYAFFDKGDTVTIKFTNIDKATFDFWRTLEYSYQSIGNPFSSPTKVIGNISAGALGYFGGYAVQYRGITIPK